MDFDAVLSRRKMVRNFSDTPVPPNILEKVLVAALKAPSAGFTQGVDLLVLVHPDQLARYWEATTTPEWNAATRRAGMMRAPVIVLPLCNPAAYADRYGEPDKTGSGLDRIESWPVPYWWVDAAFATMNILLAAVDNGLAAGFLGMFRGEDEVLTSFGVPSGYRALGAVLLGQPAEPDPASASLGRGRRPPDEVIHRGSW